MGNYNESNRRGNFNKRRNNNHPQDADKAARIADLIEKQTKNLNMIEASVKFLDEFIKNGQENKISMKEVIDNLSNNGFTQDETKIISQFNYLLIDLANAQKSSFISSEPNRIGIRVEYIHERFRTSYRKELYSIIDEMMSKYDLFGVRVQVVNNNAEG